MLLISDVGNTQTVLGLWDVKRENVVERWRIGTSHISTEDEFMVHVNHFLELSKHNFEEIEGFCVASVVPAVNNIFVYFSQKYLKRPPIFVNTNNATWIKWNVRTPQEMGADRIADVIAAKKLYKSDVIVVDFGTAITIDILTDEYEGGAILVGPKTSLSALFSKAAKLPAVPEEIPASAIGKDTKTNIQAGVMLGTIFAIDGLIELYEKEFSKKFKVISTGGEGKNLSALSRKVDKYDPDLTLKGVSFYYEELKKHEGASC